MPAKRADFFFSNAPKLRYHGNQIQVEVTSGVHIPARFTIKKYLKIVYISLKPYILCIKSLKLKNKFYYEKKCGNVTNELPRKMVKIRNPIVKQWPLSWDFLTSFPNNSSLLIKMVLLDIKFLSMHSSKM